MAFDVLRVAEHVHGHLGWLAAATLVHPAVLLRSPTRRAHFSVALATGFATVVGALGAWLYEPYRMRVKPRIFIDARWVGMMFERKEHLAFGAIMLTWAGALAYAGSFGAREETRVPLRTFAFRAFVAAAGCAIATAALGTLVASYSTF
jgi:hypothetical protein